MSTKLVDKILWKKRKEIRRSKEEKDAEEWVLLRSLRPPQERMGQVSGPQVTGDLLGGWSRSAGKGGVKLAGMKFQSIREVLSPGRVLWEKKNKKNNAFFAYFNVFGLQSDCQWPMMNFRGMYSRESSILLQKWRKMGRAVGQRSMEYSSGAIFFYHSLTHCASGTSLIVCLTLSCTHFHGCN